VKCGLLSYESRGFPALVPPPVANIIIGSRKLQEIFSAETPLETV
jgi:hypothetical protein